MGADTILIREARPDDVYALGDIERAAGRLFVGIDMVEIADDEPLPEDILLGYQACGRAWVTVDEVDRPVGYLLADILDGNAHIEQLSVMPSHMRQGRGRALIEHAVAWATERGMGEVTLTTFADVPWNGPYYERLGFQRVSERDMSPELQALWNDEASRGLARWPRIWMRRIVSR